MHDFQIHIGEQLRKEKASQVRRALTVGVGRETHREENPSQEALFSSVIN